VTRRPLNFRARCTGSRGPRSRRVQRAAGQPHRPRDHVRGADRLGRGEACGLDSRPGRCRPCPTSGRPRRDRKEGRFRVCRARSQEEVMTRYSLTL
jgi:hypothetical protein